MVISAGRIFNVYNALEQPRAVGESFFSSHESSRVESSALESRVESRVIEKLKSESESSHESSGLESRVESRVIVLKISRPESPVESYVIYSSLKHGFDGFPEILLQM